MKPRYSSLLLLFLLLLAGCSGDGNRPVGQVSGIVEDINGNVVRNARVFVSGGPSTFSNSSGAYVLTGVTGPEHIIKASVRQDGIDYYGENTVQIFELERSKTTNITVVRKDQRATLQGTVRDRFGNLVRGAKVFAASNNELSSTYAITNNDGRFELTSLLGGVSYTVVASALGYDSDSDSITIPADQSRDLDFTLGNPSGNLLDAPQNFDASAWTTPAVATTRAASSSQEKEAYTAVKKLIDGRSATSKQTRVTVNGNNVEVDLFWDYVGRNDILGFGIYRGAGNTNQLAAIDFFRDPQAIFYQDLDDDLHENQTWSYAMTAINTDDPTSSNNESDFTPIIAVQTLGDLALNPVTTGPLAFHWSAGSGATTYTVFLYDRYPSLAFTPVWTKNTAASDVVYDGPALTASHTYYYIVVGDANGNKSHTISPVGTFITGP